LGALQEIEHHVAKLLCRVAHWPACLPGTKGPVSSVSDWS
jgi:hypothetical protein